MREQNDTSKRRRFGFRQLFDLFMGLLYLALAIVFAFGSKFNLSFAIFEGNNLNYLFAAMIGLYGAWRLYRVFSNNNYD